MANLDTIYALVKIPFILVGGSNRNKYVCISPGWSYQPSLILRHLSRLVVSIPVGGF